MNRVWNLGRDSYEKPKDLTADVDPKEVKELRRMTHKTIKRVTEDLDRFRFNTMLAGLMEFTNYLGKAQETSVVSSPAWQEAMETLILLLAPSTPFLAEELWVSSGHPYSVHNQLLPIWDEDLVKEEQITLVIQVNGKVRDRITVPASIAEDEVREISQENERVKPFLVGKKVANIVYVPGRLVNIVVR